jgi:hypothetical protein
MILSPNGNEDFRTIIHLERDETGKEEHAEIHVRGRIRSQETDHYPRQMNDVENSVYLPGDFRYFISIPSSIQEKVEAGFFTRRAKSQARS